jgi:hypothetical protein
MHLKSIDTVRPKNIELILFHEDSRNREHRPLGKGCPTAEGLRLHGHESIKAHVKLSATWVNVRQDRIDSLVMETWAWTTNSKVLN